MITSPAADSMGTEIISPACHLKAWTRLVGSTMSEPILPGDGHEDGDLKVMAMPDIPETVATCLAMNVDMSEGSNHLE